MQQKEGRPTGLLVSSKQSMAELKKRNKKLQLQSLQLEAVSYLRKICYDLLGIHFVCNIVMRALLVDSFVLKPMAVVKLLSWSLRSGAPLTAGVPICGNSTTMC